MNNNFLGIRGLYKTHMDGLKPFNSKSVTYTYIGYTEHNSRGQPIVWHSSVSRRSQELANLTPIIQILWVNTWVYPLLMVHQGNSKCPDVSETRF